MIRKTILALALVATPVYAGNVEDWSAIAPGKDVGGFADSNGSKCDVLQADGPQGGQKSVQITATLVQGGYAGIWHNLATAADLSKSANLKFMAKASLPGELQMDIQDAHNVSYTVNFTVPSASWTAVTIPISSFKLNPYYQPPEAVKGSPEDLSQVGKIGFGTHIVGSAVVNIGPITTDGVGSPAASASAAAAPAPIVAKGAPLVIQDFSTDDPKAGGTFADSNGSTFSYAVKPNSNKPGAKFLVISFNEVQGGYCGMFYHTGNTWDGQDWTGGQALQMTVYSKVPVVLGVAFKDKNNNQYTADAPSTKGTGWETIQIPMASFKLDPYYTPPDAVKGAPEDLSAVKSFNLQPKTAVKATIAVDQLEIIK
ncbi:MAG TPA: carbohydrate binding domain-containing protein [bacterium]|nr:carbohydrate binding domain-containing protein [bacterium]